MTIAGYVDQVMTREIVGWAADTDASNGSVIVEVIAEGRVIASGTAYLYREDLRAAGIGDGRHGFRIAIPDVPDGVPVSCRSRGSDAELPRSQPGLDATQRFEGRFHHTQRFGLPSPAYGLKEGPMPKGAEAIVERLVRSFRAAIERDTGKLGKLWGPVVDDLHGEPGSTGACGRRGSEPGVGPFRGSRRFSARFAHAALDARRVCRRGL